MYTSTKVIHHFSRQLLKLLQKSACKQLLMMLNDVTFYKSNSLFPRYSNRNFDYIYLHKLFISGNIFVSSLLVLKLLLGIMELQESSDVDNMHEKLRLRRESRRKKILENAKSRLEKLSVRQGGDGDTDLTSKRASFSVEQDCEYSDPEVEPDIPEHIHRMPPPTFQQFEDVLKSFDSTQSNEHTIQEKEKTFLKYKLHVILAVTVAYIATLVINQSEGKKFFVIIPFALVLLSDLTIFHQQKQRNPMIDMLVIFGIRPQHILYALNVFTNIQIVVTDLSIFIFYFGVATFFGNQFVHLAEIK